MHKLVIIILGVIILLPNCMLADNYRLIVSLEHFTDPNSTTIDMTKIIPGWPGTPKILMATFHRTLG